VLIDQAGTGSNTLLVPDLTLRTYTVWVGLSGTGNIAQTGGLHVTNEVNLGSGAGAIGTYSLGGGELTIANPTGSEYVGFAGTGVFDQSGGTNRTPSLFLGAMLGSSGTYRLSGSGRLDVSSYEMIGGRLFDDATGLFEQSGGTHTANFLQIGRSTTGGGTYRLSGGLLTVTGFESVETNGTFEQTGGTHAVNSLTIGGLASAPAVYTISAGELNAKFVGVGGANSPGGSTMNVAGGTTVIKSLAINGGNGVLNVSGGSLAATSAVNNGLFDATGGTFSGALVNNATLRASGGAVLNVMGGISAGSATNVAASRLVIESGAVVSANFVRQGSLEFGGAAATPATLSIRRTSEGGATSVVKALSIQTDSSGQPLGRADLSDTALAVDYTGDSPLGTVRDLLRAGFAGGTWTGNGLTSSVAAASAGREALAYGESSDLLSPTGGTLKGQAVDGTAVLVQYALAGDANLDGAVTKDDLMTVTHHMNDANAAWRQGDFDYDGRVGSGDLLILLRNYRGPRSGDAAGSVTMDAGAAAAFAQAAVPEPGAVSIVGLGVAMLAGRRRPRR
jgi:hypothetical protein